jgi:histidine triad (HIT) family protein
MYTVARWLFRLARSPVGGWLIGWTFAYMHHFLPVNRLYETERVLAFCHPQPSHRVHVLIVPKQAIPSVLALTAEHGPLLQDVFTTAQEVVKLLELETNGFRLVVNGGAYQDVMQVHWHLIAD